MSLECILDIYAGSKVFLLSRKTTFKKIVVCIQFPQDYPLSPLLIELKSKTLSTKLLDGLTKVCEKECKGLLNKAQVLISITKTLDR